MMLSIKEKEKEEEKRKERKKNGKKGRLTLINDMTILT